MAGSDSPCYGPRPEAHRGSDHRRQHNTRGCDRDLLLHHLHRVRPASSALGVRPARALALRAASSWAPRNGRLVRGGCREKPARIHGLTGARRREDHRLTPCKHRPHASGSCPARPCPVIDVDPAGAHGAIGLRLDHDPALGSATARSQNRACRSSSNACLSRALPMRSSTSAQNSCWYSKERARSSTRAGHSP